MNFICNIELVEQVLSVKRPGMAIQVPCAVYHIVKSALVRRSNEKGTRTLSSQTRFASAASPFVTITCTSCQSTPLRKRFGCCWLFQLHYLTVITFRAGGFQCEAASGMPEGLGRSDGDEYLPVGCALRRMRSLRRTRWRAGLCT